MVSLSLSLSVSLLLQSVSVSPSQSQSQSPPPVSLSLPQSGPERKLANCWSQFPPWTLLLFSLHQASVIQETILGSDLEITGVQTGNCFLSILSWKLVKFNLSIIPEIIKEMSSKKFLKLSSSKIQWKNPAAAFPAVSHI